VYICYVDEAGGFEDPASGDAATPVMVMLGLIVDAASIPALTRDLLALKRRHFPGRFTTGPALDHVLVEIKGSEVLQMTRSSSRNKRRQAQVLRADLLDLVEAHGCSVVGRVWAKEPGRSMVAAASYCYDAYPTLPEVPLFAASDNHAGLQIADLLASTMVFPMAVAAYCVPQSTNPHSSSRYREVGRSSAGRIRALQYRYHDEDGKGRGGLVVSDPVGKQSGSRLFAAG
jgi:hypothetical protein